MNFFRLRTIGLNQLNYSRCNILRFRVNIIFTHFRVKLANVYELIVVDLFLHFLLSLEYCKLSLQIATDTIELNMLLF
jgi:hypothetical protein